MDGEDGRGERQAGEHAIAIGLSEPGGKAGVSK